MKFLSHSPLESEELQFVSWVVHLSFGQVPASILGYSICSIIVDLVKDGSKVSPTGYGAKLKGLGEVGIGQDGCCCAQV